MDIINWVVLAIFIVAGGAFAGFLYYLVKDDKEYEKHMEESEEDWKNLRRRRCLKK